MKAITFIATITGALIVPTVASSAGSSNCKITNMLAISTAPVVFITVESHNSKPSCSTVGSDWALAIDTPNGRAMYAELLVAQAQGKPIQIYGSNDCGVWADRETAIAIGLAS